MRRSLPSRPSEGSRIDILDQEQIWSSGIITSVRQLTTSTIVEVRYDGWDSSSWNEQLSLTSDRLAPIYTHTARLRCLVRLFQRKSKKNYPKNRGGGGGNGSSGSGNGGNHWPCVLYIRMADNGNSRALFDLSIENKVFVEPSRPDLLPLYIQKEWMNGGLWIEIDKVDTWTSSRELKEVEGSVSGGGKNKDFSIAHESLENNPSIPGNLNDDIFERGTMVKKEYRVLNKGENTLVDLSGWKDALVDLKSLDKLDIKKKPSSVKDGGKVSMADSVSSASTSLSGSTNSKRAAAASDVKMGERQRSSERRSLRRNNKIAASSSVTTLPPEAAAVAVGTRRSTRSRLSKIPYDEIPREESKIHATGRAATRATTAKLKGDVYHNPEDGATRAEDNTPVPGAALLRNGVTVEGSNYPGYAITRSSTTGKWVASFDIRGNTVHVGKFQTQTQAKEAIDNARAEFQKAGETGGDKVLDRPRTMTLDQLKDAKEKDIAAITVEKAVSIAYRDGSLKDTGFSMHNWTMEVIKDKDKVREKDKVKLQREFLEMKKRRREEKGTPLSSNRKRGRIE